MRLKKTLVFVKGQNKVISCVEGHALGARRLPFFFRALEHCLSRTQQVRPALYGCKIFSFIGLLGTFAGFFQSEHNSVNAADRAKQRVYAKYRALSHLFFYRYIAEDLVHKSARRFSESRLSSVKKSLLF